MRKLLTMILCSLMLLAASSSVKAQEISITLWPGWTWISYPRADTLSFSTAMGSFTPMQGDIIKSQWGNAIYMGDGQWRGSISHFYPGYGYMYKSNRMIPTPLTITNAHCPEVNTLAPSNITTTTANVGGNITNSNGATITQCGVYWSTEPHPTINDNIIIAENVTIGEFTIELVGLVPSTIYYFRAFAMNSIGMAYGEEMSFTTVPPTIPEGAINGVFSVSDNQQIYFSRGNLQYIGSAATPYWKFADNQWDYFGDNGQGSTNQTIDRDLFGWGTSGYHHRDYSYQPWSTSTNYTEYYAYGMYSYNLYDQTGMADWGYNAISNGGNVENNGWRTLTTDEWNYLLLSRSTTSGIRFAKGKVNNVNGIILLPDNWVTTTYMLNNTNSIETDFNCNTISIEEWISVFEANGAVFLPTASRRNGTVVYGTNNGYYWSSSFCYSGYANYLYFGANHIGPQNYDDISEGLSVRLVRPAENMTYYNINVTPNPAESGTITGMNSYAGGQTCTLIATANSGFTFANWTENGEVVYTNSTYSFIVEGNRNLVANFIYNVNGNHANVDLGLPSGLLWATCNVGANSPEEYGDYFAWGETMPKDVYNWETYQHCNGSNNTFTKYCTNSDLGYNGFTDNLITLLPEDDVATSNWGDDWHIPTKEDWQELFNNTTHPDTIQNGVLGKLFTAANGNSIFIPAAGFRNENSFYDVGSFGEYCSSSLFTELSYYAWKLFFSGEYCDMYFFGDRNWGRPVRPVRSAPQSGVPIGAINGKFTINANGNQVYFSQGNLQYQASTNTWRFAENQQDVIGNSNSNISSTYNGWIDLFGWGTSGYDNKYPWMTSEIETDYGDNQNNIAYTEYDWGQHNPISNGGNQAGLWRTLSSAELGYMVYQRNNADNLYAMGLVDGWHGLIILPDNCVLPEGIAFTPAYKDFTSTVNNFSLEQWSQLEAVGAVFLPVAGVRQGTQVSQVDESGYYWSTDILSPEDGAREMWFGRMFIYYNPGIGGSFSRHNGISVRLVHNAE